MPGRKVPPVRESNQTKLYGTNEKSDPGSTPLGRAAVFLRSFNVGEGVAQIVWVETPETSSVDMGGQKFTLRETESRNSMGSPGQLINPLIK